MLVFDRGESSPRTNDCWERMVKRFYNVLRDLPPNQQEALIMEKISKQKYNGIPKHLQTKQSPKKIKYYSLSSYLVSVVFLFCLFFWIFLTDCMPYLDRTGAVVRHPITQQFIWWTHIELQLI